jgi:type IV pilus assembly protein PilC
MANFEYKARSKEGEPRSGIVTASSEDAALDALQQNGLTIIAIREDAGPSLIERGITFGSGVKQKDIVVFSRQLATLFEARIPVASALRTLMTEARKPGLKRIIAQILDDVAGGMSLSQSMAKHPHVFSSFYVNLVRSGEESGKLQDIFTYLADYLERSYYLAAKARNSLIYPAFVLVAFTGVLVVMLVVVFPRLISIFEETGQPIPFYTQAVIYLSVFLQRWGILLLIALVGGGVLIWRWAATAAGKLFFHSLQVNVPIMGELYRKLFMARLTDNLQTLIAGGIPIVRALSITGDVVGNVVYKHALERAIESVKGGSTISAAFEATPEIPPLVTQMIRIGETSGRLDFILASVARFYSKDVDSVLESIVALVEPALIIFLGIGVGALVASVLVPLYNLVGSI